MASEVKAGSFKDWIDEERKAIEEERAINRRILRTQELKSDLLGLLLLGVIFAVIFLAAELKSVVPLFCSVFEVAVYILAKM